MSIESRIDIVVKNLNQLNKLADNLKNINKTNEKLVKGLDRIESQLNKINTNGVAFKKISKDARDASKEVNNLGSRIADIISNNKGGIGNLGIGSLLGVGAVSGITKITDGFKNLVPAVNAVTSKIPVLGEKLQMVQQQATGFDAVFDGILHNIANHPSLWGAAAVALTVFGGKFPVVVKGVKQLGVTLNGVGQAVTNNIIGKLVPATKHLVDMRVALVDVREQMENMTRGASLEELNIMVGMARKEMESFWHMTGKAEDAAIKLAVAMAAQRKEQTAINDLLFKAQGKATTAEQADNKRALDAQKQKATHSFDMFSTEAKQLEILQRKNKLFIDSAGHYQRLVEKGGKLLDIEERIKRVMDRKKRGFGGVGKGGKGAENLMLGAGFPLLFGGGVGSVGGGVAGALLGNKMGSGGFGMQILLSAVGQMMDTAVQKAAKLGESLKSINMNDLVESGVRLSGELQSQVTHLQKIGQIEQARALLAAQVMDQTGASAGVLGDINNMTNILKATWNDLVGSAGAFLGVLAGPLITALAGVLKIVTEIIKIFNRGFSTLRDGLRGLGEKFAPGLVEAIDNAMDKLNAGLQEALGKADQLARKLDLEADTLMTKRTLREGITSGGSFEAQRKNAEKNKDLSMIDLRNQRRAELEKLNLEPESKAEKEFKGVTKQMKLDIEGKYAKEIENIDAKEQKLIAKLERQNELKAALLGIDQKIAQARSDEDKELEFRLNAQKEIASITNKLMEDTAGKDDAEKQLKIEAAKLDIAKVNFALETKIDEYRKEKKEEAENIIADLENQNALLEGKVAGNEEEIKQLQTIEKIVDKIGEGYREQVTALIKKNGQLKETAENTDNVNKEWDKIKDTIASGLHDAIMGLIDGTKSLSESLAGVAKQIASMMLQKAIMRLPFLAAEGAYAPGGFKAFASGGMATRPTLGLVGEAGEDEYIIPASKMAASMQRYSAGARGEAVIPGTGSSASGGAAGGSSTTVSYSGPILNFNSEEFVPKSAVGQIIATATSQGAKAGENRTLTTLRNSRSARSRIGM